MRKLGKITFDASLSAIPANAFRDNLALESIVIPECVKSIGSCAFNGCKNLKSITLKNENTTFSSGVFGYTAIESFTLPEGMTKISSSLFANCSKLSSITIPDGVTTIGDSAFRNCTSLSVDIPSSVKTIGDNAFQNCGFSSLVIPEGVEKIGNRAFKNCNNLTSVKIPSTITSIGIGAFESCDNLSSVSYYEHKEMDNRFSIESLLMQNDIKLGSGVFQDTKLNEDIFDTKWSDISLGAYDIIYVSTDDKIIEFNSVDDWKTIIEDNDYSTYNKVSDSSVKRRYLISNMYCSLSVDGSVLTSNIDLHSYISDKFGGSNYSNNSSSIQFVYDGNSIKKCHQNAILDISTKFENLCINGDEIDSLSNLNFNSDQEIVLRINSDLIDLNNMWSNEIEEKIYSYDVSYKKDSDSNMFYYVSNEKVVE